MNEKKIGTNSYFLYYFITTFRSSFENTNFNVKFWYKRVLNYISGFNGSVISVDFLNGIILVCTVFIFSESIL